MEFADSPKTNSEKEQLAKEAQKVTASSGLISGNDNPDDDFSSFITIKGNADWVINKNKNMPPLANIPEYDSPPPSSWPMQVIKRVIIGASITVISLAALNSFLLTYRPSAAPNITHYDNVLNFELQYEMPPAGTTDTLTLAQIRWILREGIRIETMRDIVNPRNESAVAEFNTMVNNYNARVSDIRYVEQDMEHAQREIEAIRSLIVQEAVSEARSWNQSGL